MLSFLYNYFSQVSCEGAFRPEKQRFGRKGRPKGALRRTVIQEGLQYRVSCIKISHETGWAVQQEGCTGYHSRYSTKSYTGKVGKSSFLYNFSYLAGVRGAGATAMRAPGRRRWKERRAAPEVAGGKTAPCMIATPLFRLAARPGGALYDRDALIPPGSVSRPSRNNRQRSR